jgi:hypothetical protein
MLQRNIDVSSGLINEVIGTVKNIIIGIDGKPQQIQVIFNEKMYHLKPVTTSLNFFTDHSYSENNFP